jgi:hypothetical protein
MGCSNSLQEASMRYREQHRNRRYLLHDNTVEQLQACVEEFGDQVSDDSFRVGATVQVDREGRIHGVPVTDIPDTAPGLAGCTRIALRNMNVPDLPLRSDSSEDAASVPAKPMGNEVANPAIVVEFVVLLGEFAAQHGAKTVLYAVTIEVLAGLAITAASRLTAKCRRVKEACIISCSDAELPTWDPGGNPFHRCMRECMERAGCFYNPP